MAYVLAIYEIDRAWGGPEEGGWWFDTGVLARVVAIKRTEEAANEACRRINGLLHTFQRHNRNVRDIGSVLYDGGMYQCEVYENAAPAGYPEVRPHYE